MPSLRPVTDMARFTVRQCVAGPLGAGPGLPKPSLRP